jgi:hypothetical protein
MRQEPAVDIEGHLSRAPGHAADPPGLALLAGSAADVPLQRYRRAADRQGELQVGRIEAEGEAVPQAPRLQIEAEQAAFHVPALEVELAVADADVIERKGGADGLVPRRAAQQAVIEDEARPVDLDADRFLPHEQRGGRQVGIDRGERYQVLVADGKILYVAEFKPQREEG